MKELSKVQMEVTTGGISSESVIGIMCGATVAFACSGIFAPFAGATGIGCAVGLYAMHVWGEL